MVEPVGCRDANLEALSVRNPERLKHRQIAAEVVRRTDVGPDPLALDAIGSRGGRKGSSEAVGVEVLSGLQTLPGIAGQDRHEAWILVRTEPGARADGLSLQTAGHGDVG